MNIQALKTLSNEIHTAMPFASRTQLEAASKLSALLLKSMELNQEATI
ncbi:hypothetical protein ACF8FL_06275 [Vibrio sp. zbq_19]